MKKEDNIQEQTPPNQLPSPEETPNLAQSKKGSFLIPEPEDTPRVQHSKKHALDLSIKEAAVANAAGGFGGSQITPYALALGSNSFHIGLLSAISGLFGPLAQLYGSKLMTKQSRKTIVIHFVFLQALMWLPIAALTYLLYKGLLTTYLPYLLIILYFLLVVMGSVTAPAWFSWLGDLVPQDKKGAYFSKRNRIGGIVAIITALAGALFLDLTKTKGFLMLGFAILFILTFTFRLWSMMIFRKEFSPKIKIKKSDNIPFKKFFHQFKNYRTYLTYRTLFHFAQMILAPFVAVYMLQDLGFSYTTFMIVGLSSSVFYLLFMKVAGKFSDKYGNAKMIKFAGIVFTISPIAWLFFTNPIYLIITTSLLGGIANAALIIAATNYAYDTIPQKQRGVGSAYSGIVFGFGTFFGSIVGGILLTFFTIDFMKPFFFVLIISIILRLLINIVYLPRIKEGKSVPSLPPMKVNLAHPFRTIDKEISWFQHVFK